MASCLEGTPDSEREEEEVGVRRTLPSGRTKGASRIDGGQETEQVKWEGQATEDKDGLCGHISM